MDLNQKDEAFAAILKADQVDVTAALAYVDSLTDERKKNELVAKLAGRLSEVPDFNGLYRVLKERQTVFSGNNFTMVSIRDLLTRACRDRMDKAFLKAADFGGRVKPQESFRRFDLLRSLHKGKQVIDKAWGFGVVKDIDSFYSRVTIDFTGHPDHQLSFDTVCKTISSAAPDHIYSKLNDKEQRAEVMAMAREMPGELVKEVLRCFGNMPVQRLEETLTDLGLIGSDTPGWKTFWEKARAELRQDKRVKIPALRADCIQLLLAAETFDDNWFKRFQKDRNTKSIIESIKALEAFLASEKKTIKDLDETDTAIVKDRLEFAIKGTKKMAVDDEDAALFSRLATMSCRYGFDIDGLREYLCQESPSVKDDDVREMNFIKASRKLAVRDVTDLAKLVHEGGEDYDRILLDNLSLMPYGLLDNVLNLLKDTDACAQKCSDMLKDPEAPATLVVWVFRNKYPRPAKSKAAKQQTQAQGTQSPDDERLGNWKNLPSLIDLLNQAIAIIETTMAGEELRMQNQLKEMFSSEGWIEMVLEKLPKGYRPLLFERIQASKAWDPGANRSLLKRMEAKFPDELKKHRKEEAAVKAYTPYTSWHSYKKRQLEYKKLVEKDIPQNAKDIEFARGLGDLRENFEYQSAKDLQSVLLQRQNTLQKELGYVKGTDFANANTDAVGCGVTVSIRMADGSTAKYSVLGEWDNDEALGIISNLTHMAKSLEGHKTGDTVKVPCADGDTTAVIEKIEPLSDEIRNWIVSDPE
ncbi:MAG: GreA/GreB family elongation factor [Kiritimatiellae bacterium]|nr:GreA/GreB family elongation factor [Kiritimatiellia bacterium]